MKRFYLSIVIAVLGVVSALASEASFDRTMQVSGRVELNVATGTGNIHLIPGSDNSVHVVGKVKSGWGGCEDLVQEIATHPSIIQEGNVIHIGVSHVNMHNITIDYQIEAPAGVFLEARSGSGDVIADGVGENAKLFSGSGNIHASGLRGNFSIEIGSGNIFAEQIGKGEVKVSTGSGNVELKNLNGGLDAGTGSGSIKVSGVPTASWRIHTGSGNVELLTQNSPLSLDASTGWGSIKCDREISERSAVNLHHLKGSINGGGPTVRIETGSGDIWVH